MRSRAPARRQRGGRPDADAGDGHQQRRARRAPAAHLPATQLGSSRAALVRSGIRAHPSTWKETSSAPARGLQARTARRRRPSSSANTSPARTGACGRPRLDPRDRGHALARHRCGHELRRSRARRRRGERRRLPRLRALPDCSCSQDEVVLVAAPGDLQPERQATRARCHGDADDRLPGQVERVAEVAVVVVELTDRLAAELARRPVREREGGAFHCGREQQVVALVERAPRGRDLVRPVAGRHVVLDAQPEALLDQRARVVAHEAACEQGALTRGVVPARERVPDLERRHELGLRPLDRRPGGLGERLDGLCEALPHLVVEPDVAEVGRGRHAQMRELARARARPTRSRGRAPAASVDPARPGRPSR